MGVFGIGGRDKDDGEKRKLAIDPAQAAKTLPVHDFDIAEISAARGRKLGGYHLMTAQNPVFIISFTGGSEHA